MTPQEKKALSLKRDCRNTFGENDKSSRKTIRFRKRSVNKSFRRAEHQAVAKDDIDQIDSAVVGLKRKGWRKASDTPLGKVLLRNKTILLEHDIRKQASSDASFYNRLERFLSLREITGTRFSIILRQTRSVAENLYGAELNLEIASLNILQDFLKSK